MLNKKYYTKEVLIIIDNDEELLGAFKEEARMCEDISITDQEAIKILAEIIRDYFWDNELIEKNKSVRWHEVAEQQLERIKGEQND